MKVLLSSTMWAWLALCAATAGFGALSLAMDRHFEGIFGRGTSPGAKRRWLQLAGAVGLTVSLVASLQAQGSAQGWVLWCGVLTVAALVLMLLLCYVPRWAPLVSIVSVVSVVSIGLYLLYGWRG